MTYEELKADRTEFPSFDEGKLTDCIHAFGDMLHEQAEHISKLAMSGKTTEINITEHIGVDYVPYLEISMNQRNDVWMR